MYLLDPSTTERYLRERGQLDPQETVRATELSGGVSNQVLLIERGRGDRFVLKQAREQLRVQQEWKCDVRRIWREMDVLRLCGEGLRDGEIQYDLEVASRVPEILFEDRGNFCYAMTAAPGGAPDLEGESPRGRCRQRGRGARRSHAAENSQTLLAAPRS